MGGWRGGGSSGGGDGQLVGDLLGGSELATKLVQLVTDELVEVVEGTLDFSLMLLGQRLVEPLPFGVVEADLIVIAEAVILLLQHQPQNSRLSGAGLALTQTERQSKR